MPVPRLRVLPNNTPWKSKGCPTAPVAIPINGAPLNHRASDFYLKHKFYGAQQKFACASCHQESFCADCHAAGFEIKRAINSRTPLNGRSRTAEITLAGTGLEGRIDPASCLKCHGRQNNEGAKMSQVKKTFLHPFMLILLILLPGRMRRCESAGEHQCQYRHPPFGWLPSGHMTAAKANVQTCADCHGADYGGGMPRSPVPSVIWEIRIQCIPPGGGLLPTPCTRTTSS